MADSETTITWRSIPKPLPLRQERLLGIAIAFGNEWLGRYVSLFKIINLVLW